MTSLEPRTSRPRALRTSMVLGAALAMLGAVASRAAAQDVDMEKTTNGPTNANPTAPDFDNEDAANGAGVPILMPGSTVTWTYKVTNTGNVAFTFNEVVIVDDGGTPGSTADDLSTTGGEITFSSVQTGDVDNMLEPGEVWLYNAAGTVGTGPYENQASVTVPGATDSDLSHYRNPAEPAPTATPTATPTLTPTPKPNGAACATAAECGSTFCADEVCCDTACSGPDERCDLRDGTCANTAVPAPALSTQGLAVAALALCAIAAVALARRRWRA